MISFFQCRLVVSVSLIAWICFDDSLYLVNFAWKSSCWDQFWKLSVDKVYWNSKLACHWIKPHCLIRFKKLWVNDHSCFSDEVSWVKVNVFVFLHIIDNPQEIHKKVSVSTVVKAFQVSFNLRQFHQINDHFTCLQDFLFYGLSVHADNACNYGISN